MHACCLKLQFNCSTNVVNYQNSLEKHSVTPQFIMIISCGLIKFDLTALSILSVANKITYIQVHVNMPYSTTQTYTCIPFACNCNFFNNRTFPGLTRILKGLQGVGVNVGAVTVVSLWEHQNGADDIYVIWLCDTVLRVLVWKMDSTFNCHILWVSK